jgi:AcrR family transcriptional regulator
MRRRLTIYRVSSATEGSAAYSCTMSQQVALSARKRKATRGRIAHAAAQLVGENGLTNTTVEQIAAAAEIGRATFFRYFSSKEDAVAEGMTRRWLDLITAAIANQPSDLSAHDVVLAAFTELADGFAEMSDQVKELAVLTRASPALSAWTLQIYVGYEDAIAELVAPRLPDLQLNDPRPRLIGALAMASVRIALDDWLRHGGSLPERVHQALASVSLR